MIFWHCILDEFQIYFFFKSEGGSIEIPMISMEQFKCFAGFVTRLDYGIIH